MPEREASIQARGITSLAQCYTAGARYGPEVSRAASAALRALLVDGPFLP